MQKAGKKTKQDWGGVGDLFSSLLPRGMQKTIRGFKSSMRSVGRLSKSFKVLKAAWASVGIGLAIMAIEALIENWDKLSEAIGLTSASEKEFGEISERTNEELKATLTELVSKRETYIKLLDDENVSDERKLALLKQINSEVGGIVDTEADLKTQRDQASSAFSDLIKLERARIQNEEALAKVQVARNNRESGNSESAIKSRKRLERAEKNAVIAANKYAIQLEAHNTLLAKIQKGVDKRTLSEKERLQAEKEAEKLKQENARKAEANAKYLANLETTLDREITLSKIEEGEKREAKAMEFRHADAKAAALDAGATATQLEQLYEAHQIEKNELSKRYRDEEKEQEEADRQQALADEQALEDELFMIRTNGRDRELTAEQLKYEEEMLMSLDAQAQEELSAQQEFDRRMLQAGENQELIKMVEEQYQLKLTEIEKKGEKERGEIVQDGVDKETKIRQAGAKAVISATQNLFGTMEALAGENEKAAQGFAITGVLLAQAVALANGIKTATQSSATVWDMIAGIVASTSAVLGAFVGVKAILNEATDGGGGNVGGGTARPNVQALVPTGVARLDSPEGGNNQAFVVQSELEGANLQANNMYGQTSLNPG